MKIQIFLMILVFSLLAQQGLAQQNADTGPSKSKKEVNSFKQSVLVEYISWFESLKLKGPSISTDISALYYGVGVLYDATTYQGSWGYGGNAGFAQGYGGAGNSVSTSTYAQTRVAWQAFRGGLRLFQRFSPRFELGPAVTLIYKSISWPVNTAGNAPINTTNPSAGLFLEMRWRLTKQWEMQQAAGVFNINSSMAWRLGAGYSF